MVVYLIDHIADEVIVHRGVKAMRIVSDVYDEKWIELVFRTKLERYPAKYHSLIRVRQWNCP